MTIERPRIHPMQPVDVASIVGVTQSPSVLEVHWDDGETDSYHYVWLRDNCMCPACGDKSGGHRYLELNDIRLDVVPSDVRISEGALEIKWASPGGHRTRYEGAWLKESSYSNDARARHRHRPVLWDGALEGGLPSFSYVDVMADGSERLAMFEHLHTHGIVLVKHLPTERDEIERIAALFGYIRETHYGRIFDLVATDDERILAQTSHAIRPHHDELFRDPTPGILIMHCLIASTGGGGESVMVDGFNAAQTLRERDRDAYDLLTRMPIAHHRILSDGVDDVSHRATWQTISLDHNADVVAVRINERTMAPLMLPAGMIEPTYAALQMMLGLVYDPSAAVRFLLQPGDAVVFDNHRVLHARTAFSGVRHIRQCHVDRDEFLSRLRTMTARRSISW